MPDDGPEFHNRRFSVREIALALGLLVNFGTLLWNTARAAERFEVLRVEVSELKQSNALLTGAISRNTLLEYRVTELEKRLPTPRR
jgi:hypothetical protein